VLLLVALACICGAQQRPNKMNGLVYVQFPTDDAPTSSDMLVEMSTVVGGSGANGWVSLVITYFQPNVSSTSIAPNAQSLSLSALRTSIVQAKSLGLRVMLKPHVDLSNDAPHWRGQIGQNFTESDWRQWFQSYSTYMASMATLARETQIDILNVGTELSATEFREKDWRAVIKLCRSLYPGPLVYGTNHGDELSVNFWDALDYIGIDAYYPLSTVHYPKLPDLISSWGKLSTVLGPLAQKWKKSILFTEVGYESLSGAAITPYAGTGNLSITTQTNCYAAVYEALWTQSWFDGVFWWAWSSAVVDGGPKQYAYTVHNKPAAAVVAYMGLQWP